MGPRRVHGAVTRGWFETKKEARMARRETTEGRETMRRLALTILGSLALVATGCSRDDGERPPEQEPQGKVVMAMSAAACSNFAAATVIDRVALSFTPGNGPLAAGRSYTRAAILAHCTNPGTPLDTIDEVPAGSYEANATAHRSDDVLVGRGSKSFVVYHGETTDLTITLSPVDAEGSVAVDIDVEGDWSGLEGSNP